MVNTGKSNTNVKSKMNKYFYICIKTKEDVMYNINKARNWNSKKYEELKNLTNKEFDTIEEELNVKNGVNALTENKWVIIYQLKGKPKVELAERIKNEFIMSQVDLLISHLNSKYKIVEEIDEGRFSNTDKYAIKIKNINDIEQY